MEGRSTKKDVVMRSAAQSLCGLYSPIDRAAMPTLFLGGRVAQPGRLLLGDLGVDWARRHVGPLDVAAADDKLLCDFPSRKLERFLEEFHPLGHGDVTLFIKPCTKAPIFFLKANNDICVVDCCVDFEAVANDTRVTKEAFDIFRSILSHSFDTIVVECLSHMLPFFENKEPAEASLINFKHESFEEGIIGCNGEAVLVVMVRFLPLVWLILDSCAIGRGCGHLTLLTFLLLFGGCRYCVAARGCCCSDAAHDPRGGGTCVVKSPTMWGDPPDRRRPSCCTGKASLHRSTNCQTM